jgi:hypothetical protein
LLDFAKAYDTIDREFLFAILVDVGGGDLLFWVRLLLAHTLAVAIVNNCMSDSMEWLAGVRQGCPLSPMLYIIIAWALSCWLLENQQIGLRIGGRRRHCKQFADDIQVLLASCTEQHVRPLVEAMTVFGDASGQRLNLGKCRLLPVGNARESQVFPLREVCGIPVVLRAKALGFDFCASIGGVLTAADKDAGLCLPSTMNLLILPQIGTAF